MSSPGVTNRPLPTEGPSAGGDEFDDLFDYDGDINDPFSENYVVPQRKDDLNNASKDSGSKGKSAAGLGIDEEIEVTRKPRAPRVKLDEHRYYPISALILSILTKIQDFSPKMESLNSAKRRKTSNSKAKAMKYLPLPPLTFQPANKVTVQRCIPPARLLPTVARRPLPKSSLPGRPSHGREDGA